MVNILLMAGRRRRVQERELARLLEAITTLPVTIHVVDIDLACGAVALLGKQHELTAYDASYLELALRLGVPLATQDDALVRAAAAAGATLF
jgi:predicted nucleic acid-binding protein